MPYVPWQNHYVWLPVTLLLVLLTSCNFSARGVAQQEVATETELPPAAATELSLEHSERIRARISLPPGAQSVAFGNQSTWVSIPAKRSISRIDVATDRLVASAIPLDFEPREILQDAAHVARAVLFVLTQPDETVIPELMVLPMRETSWP